MCVFFVQTTSAVTFSIDSAQDIIILGSYKIEPNLINTGNVMLHEIPPFSEIITFFAKLPEMFSNGGL